MVDRTPRGQSERQCWKENEKSAHWSSSHAGVGGVGDDATGSRDAASERLKRSSKNTAPMKEKYIIARRTANLIRESKLSVQNAKARRCTQKPRGEALEILEGDQLRYQDQWYDFHSPLFSSSSYIPYMFFQNNSDAGLLCLKSPQVTSRRKFCVLFDREGIPIKVQRTSLV